MPLSPKCPRCNLAFGTKDPKCPQGPRMPLMLDCGHTFCSDCLARLAKQQRTAIVCHTCQHSTELSEECSLKTLWPDVYVHGLLAVNRSGFATQPQVMEFQKPSSSLFNKTQPKPNMCEECSAKVATCRCLKCEVILCGVCFEKIHRVSNVLRQHHAEPYNSKDSDVNYGKGVSPICTLHKRANEFYCTEEDVAFCAACAGLGCHKDHLVITVEDKEKSDLENLHTVLGQANNILQHSKKSSQLINSMVPACQSHGSRLIERLQEHFLQLHGTLQAREHCLIDELLKSFQKDIGSVVEMEVTLVEQIRKIETIIGDARAVISGTKRHLKGCQVVEQLTEVLDVPCYATVAGGGNLQIQFKCEDEKLFREIQVHGQWDGRFVDNLKFDKLSDVSVMNERGEHVPLVLPSGRMSALENSVPFSFDMKNGGSDLDSISLNSDYEHPSNNHELENEPKFKPRESLLENPVAKSRFKVHSELVHVSHIYNPCNFYVNLSRDLSTLMMLSRNIHTHCSYTGKRDIPSQLEVGDQVLAQFGQDGQWYRAEVIEVNDATPVSPATLRVLYTDYGNKELTTLDRIRNIHPKFLQHPLMAKRCSLVDIVPANGDRWSNETISTFARITKDRPMIMTVIKEVADLWYVDLSRPASEEIEDDGPVSVRDALVFLDMASFISPHSVPPKIGGVKQRCYLRPSLPQFGESVRVTLTFVASPHDFYVQMLGSESRHLQELMVNMQKTYDEDRGDLYTMFCPAKGMLCVAKYAHDGMWYRAEVVELKGGCQVNIRYVDYGNIELMSVWKLKKLLDVYLVLPAQAVHCRLADVGPVEETGKWQPEATTFLTKLLNEPELTIKVKEVVNRSTLSVYLHSEMMLHSVNTSMISNGWALATGPGWEPLPKTPKSLFLMAKQQKAQENNELAKPSMVPVLQPSVSPRTNAASATVVNGEQEKPKCPKVTVSHVVSPGEFYVQDSEKIRSLQQLMTKLNEWISDEDKKSSSANQWKMADMCAVCTEEDKRWYRGQIANIEESTAEVFLLDFGYKYTVELSSLMTLPESLKSVTRFTIRCHFADIVPAGDPSRWSQTSCDALKSLVLNKTCYLVVKSIMDDSSSLPVDLLLEVFVKGGAVTPDKTLYNSVAESLRDKGLALKKRNSCTILSSPRVVASVINHITSDTVPGSNHAPTKSSEVASPQQTKEVASSEQPKEVVSSEQPKEVVSSEQLKRVAPSEQPKEVVSSEQLKRVAPSEQPKEVVTSEQLKEVVSSEQLKEVASSEQLIEVVSSEQLKEVASSEQPKEVVSSEQPKEVVSSEQQREVVSSEQVKEVVSFKQVKEVVSFEQVKEVVSSEQVKEVVSFEQVKEVVSSEQVKEVVSSEQPKEVVSSEQPKEVASSERPKEVASSERPKEERSAPVQSPTIDALDGDYPPPDIPPTEKLVLGVTHVDKNGVIYGQEIKADLRYLQQLLDRVASHYKNSSPSIGRKWRQGELVVAQYTEDDGFYRGKILSLSGDFAEVYYVDYGNRETLSTERLRPAIFTDEPAQCYQCRLHDLSWNSSDGLPTDDACSALYQLLVGKVSTLQIKEKSKPGLPLVVDIITSEGKDLSQFLIDARFAVRQELRSVSPEDQRMSSTSEPSIHRPSPLKASQSFPSSKLTPNRTDSQTGKPGNQPSPGKSFKSGGDCPSQGFSSGVQETAVEASIESRQTLSQSAVDASGKAIPPAFPHPCGYGSWVGDTDASRPGTDLPSIPKRKVPSPYPRPTEPKVGEMMIMTVTQVDAPDLVYLQCIKLENVAEDNVIEVNKQLDQLLELSKWYGANYASCPVFTANQLTPGRPCIAQYSVDNCWYRAEIIDVRLSREESLEVDVLFIDYGSSDCLTRLENLRIIPNVDVSLPAQAMFCHLDGILPRKDWSMEDVRRVEDVVKHKVLITSVKNIQNGEIFVDLFEQEVYTREGVIAPLVYQSLVDDGILMFSPAHASSTSLANEDSSESIHSENDTVTVKNPSKSSVEGEELLDDPGSDV